MGQNVHKNVINYFTYLIFKWKINSVNIVQTNMTFELSAIATREEWLMFIDFLAGAHDI